MDHRARCREHHVPDRADLARVLELLIRNPDLRRQMAAKGEQQIREKYLWPDIARSMEKIYYTILEGARTAETLVAAAKRGSSTA